MKAIYLDLLNSGISGDMFLAALLGLVPEPYEILHELKELINFLPDVTKFEIELVHIERSGIQLNQLKIDIDETKDHRTAQTLRLRETQLYRPNALAIGLETRYVEPHGKTRLFVITRNGD